MKTVVTGIVLGIVFSMALIFSNRAFASDTAMDCPYVQIRHGHLFCVDLDNNS
jgi:hypothetical protein